MKPVSGDSFLGDWCVQAELGRRLAEEMAAGFRRTVARLPRLLDESAARGTDRVIVTCVDRPPPSPGNLDFFSRPELQPTGFRIQRSA